jgi:hypothetical protein
MSSRPRPEPDDLDHEAEAGERFWQQYCRVAQSLDTGDVLATLCAQLRGEPGPTPLATLVEDWLALPQWDWQHPLITPLQAESVGRYVAGVAAQVIAQAIAVALSRED